MVARATTGEQEDHSGKDDEGDGRPFHELF